MTQRPDVQEIIAPDEEADGDNLGMSFRSAMIK